MKNVISFFKNPQYYKERLILFYLLLVAVVTWILFLRFPNNVVYANYYAEDGSVFLQNIFNNGWLEAIFTPFNGYSIIGLYILEAFGWLINLLFFNEGLLSLASAFALGSIIFMASVICLPYLFFRDIFGKTNTLLVVAFSALLPLPLSPHVVIGTIGNQKWIFLYLAFLLILYKILRYKQLGLRRLILVNLGILIAAYTNVTVYMLLPFLLMPYANEYRLKPKKQSFKTFAAKLLKLREFQSLIALGILLIPQVIYVGLHGVPKLAGYLDTTFNSERLIEIFVNRTYLFGITHLINGFMSDALALLLFAILFFVGVRLLKGPSVLAFLFGVYTAGAATLLFVINRPGVSDFFNGYDHAGSGPDQFFYAQTLVMYLPIVLAATAVIALFKNNLARQALLAAFATFVIISGLASNSYYGEKWRNASVYENDAGIFTDNAIIACQKDKDQNVRVTVYPYKSGQFSLEAPRNEVCNQQLNEYQLSFDTLGLQVNNNDHFVVDRPDKFTQTFQADENDLNGIRLFISNFGQFNRGWPFKVVLRDEKCQQLIRIVDIRQTIVDNAFYNARFEPIADSKGKTYCFNVIPPTTGGFDNIAVQRSAPDVYPEGIYNENGNPQTKDVVFMPLYDKHE